MSEWKEYKLEDFATIHNEIRVPLSKMERSKRQGKYPYYGASGIIDYLDDYLFDGEYVLISEDGENLKSRQTPIAFKANGKFWVNNHAHIIKAEKDFLNDLLVFYFKNLDLNPYITGAVQPKLNKANLLSIPIFLPEQEEEQHAIAEVLSSLDDKIDLLHSQNQTLEQIAETLHESWFADRDLNSRISDLIELQNGYAFKSKSFQGLGENRVLKIKNISGGIGDIETTDFVSKEIAETLDEKFLVSTGDILFAMAGAKIGKMGIIPKTEYKLWLNQRVGLFKERYYGSRFLAYLHLKSDYGKDYIDNTATGSAQPNISGTGIENCEFPEINEQEIIEYSAQLAPLFEKLIFNLGQIQKIESIRNILLPKLMSGEVRVEMSEQD